MACPKRTVRPLVTNGLRTNAARLTHRGVDHALHIDYGALPAAEQIRIGTGAVAEGLTNRDLAGFIRSIKRLLQQAGRHSADVIYCNGGSTCQVGYYVGKLLGRPVIAHVHSPYNRRYILLYRLHRANRVVFVSRAIENSICTKQKLHGARCVVYNGVDLNRFRPPSVKNPMWRERLGIRRRSVVFGQVSSLINRKGIDVLLRAFAQVHRGNIDTRLVIVGEGPDRSQFERVAREAGLIGSVHFVGDEPDPLPYYQHVFDIHVLASRSDAFPLSTLEAGACGLPNIGANVDGIPEQVIDGVSGLLFASEDHNSLAKQMSALASDEYRRFSLGEAARRVAGAQFSLEQLCQSVQLAILATVADWTRDARLKLD